MTKLHHRLCLFVAAALPTTSTQAQTSTLPRLGTAHEGASSSSYFGGYPEGRYQVIDGSRRGGPMLLTGLRLRVDYRDHNALAVGRSWSRVSLDLSESRAYATMSASFASNITGRPARVFSAPMSWPTQSGYPSTYPAPWGGRQGGLTMSFANAWVYSGVDDLLFDFRFLGGQLANQGAWWTGATGQKGPTTQPILRHYPLDGEQASTVRRPGLTRGMPTVPGPSCMDSAFGTGGTGFASIEGSCHVAAGGGQDTHLEFRSLLTAPNAPVLKAVSTGRLSNGLQLGARCNRLFLDPATPWVLLPATTGPRVGYSPWVRLSAPWTGALSRAQLFVQAAWTDSVSNRLGLSQGLEFTLPVTTPYASLPPQKTAQALFENAATADVAPFYSAYYVFFQLQH